MEHFIEINQFQRLQAFARNANIYYYSPVYLVGSSLKKPDFRDVDILIILTSEYFSLRYGSVKNFLKAYCDGSGTVPEVWLKDCEKKWRQGCGETKLNLDLKILPQMLFIENEDHLRIDK